MKKSLSCKFNALRELNSLYETLRTFVRLTRHSGVTPGPQGIHMTQNLYYSVRFLYIFTQPVTTFDNHSLPGMRQFREI